MSASDFAGTEYDFAAGSLYGLRGWNMDDQGRLHGVTHREVWRPGENVSVCKQMVRVPCPGPETLELPAGGPSLAEQAVAPKRKLGRKARTVTPPPSPYLSSAFDRQSCGSEFCRRGEYHEVPSPHHFDPACQCGFWAYDEAGFQGHGSVIGVIEAFGKTTIGTKGFRAEKARIVGLCAEDDNGDRLSLSVQARLERLYGVPVFDDMDALVAEFPGVLRTWDEPGEDFWDAKIPTPVDPLMRSLMQSYASLQAQMTRSSRMFSGGWTA